MEYQDTCSKRHSDFIILHSYVYVSSILPLTDCKEILGRIKVEAEPGAAKGYLPLI